MSEFVGIWWDFGCSRLNLLLWGRTLLSWLACWKLWWSCGEAQRKPWNKMKRPRSIFLPSLEMSCPSISRPLRYIKCHVYSYSCSLSVIYPWTTVKHCLICGLGWAVHCSSYTNGFIHAPSCSSNIQVSKPYLSLSPALILNLLPNLLSCLQLWCSVQAEEADPRSCANTVQPAVRLHL